MKLISVFLMVFIFTSCGDNRMLHWKDLEESIGGGGNSGDGNSDSDNSSGTSGTDPDKNNPGGDSDGGSDGGSNGGPNNPGGDSDGGPDGGSNGGPNNPGGDSDGGPDGGSNGGPNNPGGDSDGGPDGGSNGGPNNPGGDSDGGPDGGSNGGPNNPGGDSNGGSDGGSNDPEDEDANYPDPDDEVPVDDIADVCAGVYDEEFDIISTEKELRFAECDNCEWNKNGNLEKRNAFFQARSEEVKEIKIPETAILCEMEIESVENQKIWYDDHFILSLNDIALASTEADLIDMLMTKGENMLPNYNWEDIVGNPWVNESTGQQSAFCLGEGSICSWPKTNRWGKMKFKISSEEIMKIAALDINKRIHQLRFTTIGDNDNRSDCKHSPFKFRIKVRYAIERGNAQHSAP